MSGRIGPRFATALDRNGKRWMNSYLSVSTYNNGDPIPQVTDFTTWANLTTGAWCYYANDIGYNSTYAKLYNYYALTDSRGMLPWGYRLPTAQDFIGAWLFAYDGVLPPSPYNRTVYPGHRSKFADFASIDVTVFFWTSETNDQDQPLYYALTNDESENVSTDRQDGYTIWLIEQ